MALRLGSTLESYVSRTRVSPRIRRFEALRLYPSVRLRRADGGMSQQFLDGTQVGAALQQVRGEGMAQGVGGDAALERGAAHLQAKPAPDVRGGEPPSALGEE